PPNRSHRPMSPRLTLPRGVARAQHAMSDRHVATVRHAELASAASSETARAAPHRLERARARTLPRIPAMAQPVTSLAEAHPWPQLSLLRVAPFRPPHQERQGRRLLNTAVASAGLVLAFPFMLVIAALIKLTSR